MVLETHMKLSVAGPDFPEKKKIAPKIEKMEKLKNLSLIFSEFVL